MSEDKRQEKRLQMKPDLKSELSDGKTGFFVVVDDISSNGIRMGKVPENFDATVQKCLAVVNASSDDFKLTLQPCWSTSSTQGEYKKIGFKIENPSKAWLDFVTGLQKRSGNENERGADRHNTTGLMALISDGKKTYYGVVDDVSQSGLQLSQVSPDLDDSASQYSVVIQSPTGDVKVSMHPCWMRTSQKGMYRTIGFKVENPPAGWQKLITELEREGSNLSFLVVDDEDEELLE